jgi:hypothetical protein
LRLNATHAASPPGGGCGRSASRTRSHVDGIDDVFDADRHPMEGSARTAFVELACIGKHALGIAVLPA